jgi:hypothetical protein
VERGWIARADAVQRSLAAVRFFYDSDQSGSPAATGFNGFSIIFWICILARGCGDRNCR